MRRRGGEGGAVRCERDGRRLAANLRILRGVAGLSLSELARRSGVAKATLSRLESGAGNPTLETVFSLSEALNVPIASLLADRADPEIVLVRSADAEAVGDDGVDLRILRRIVLPTGSIEVYDQRIRPGTRQYSHGHSGREHHIVTQGVLRLGPPDAPYELYPGDYACFSATHPHCYEAVGREEVVSVLLLDHTGEGTARNGRRTANGVAGHHTSSARRS
ncbi:helix-turn-helix domain-containing protein [Marinactinospora thermotolerans]|uniref:helix-turn-helix domain-containing protein n=1 Tax=Marinactinospora thermotolerans TaxID=531310 RepID=UPI003D8D7532